MKQKIQATLKTVPQLLAEGWSMSKSANQMEPPPGKKWWLVKDTSMLGCTVELTPQMKGYADSKGRMWSTHVIATLHQASTARPAERPKDAAPIPRCTCDIKAMMDRGCQCGAFKAEQNAKRNSSIHLH